MNIRRFVGPDGMVELQLPGSKGTIRRWPIDAKQMIEQGGAQPVPLSGAPAAPPAQAPVPPAPVQPPPAGGGQKPSGKQSGD